MAGLRDIIKKRMDLLDKAGEDAPAATKVSTPAPAPAAAPITSSEAAKKAARFKWERDNPGVPYKEPQPGKANGGLVRGVGTGTSDSNLVPMSKGEFVLPADTVKKLGVRNLRDLIDETHVPIPGRQKGLVNGSKEPFDPKKHFGTGKYTVRPSTTGAFDRVMNAQLMGIEDANARGIPRNPTSAPIEVKNTTTDAFNKARGVQPKLTAAEAELAAQSRTAGLREATKSLAEQAVGRAKLAAGNAPAPEVAPKRIPGLGWAGPALGVAAEAYGAKQRVNEGMSPTEAYPRAATNFAAGMASAKLADALVSPVASAVQSMPMRGANLAAGGLRMAGQGAGFIAGAAGMDEYANRVLDATGKQYSDKEAAENARYAAAIPADWPKDVPHPAQFQMTRDKAELYGPTNTVPGKMPAVPAGPTDAMADAVAAQEQHSGVRTAPLPPEQRYKNAADVPRSEVPEGGGFASSNRLGMRAYTKDTMPAPMGVTDTTSPEVKAADMANRQRWTAEAAAIDKRMADQDLATQERFQRMGDLNKKNVAEYERGQLADKLATRARAYRPEELAGLQNQYKDAGYRVLESTRGLKDLSETQADRAKQKLLAEATAKRDEMGLRGQMYAADQKLVGDKLQADATLGAAAAKGQAELWKLQSDMRKENRKGFNDWAQTTFTRPVLDKNGQVTGNTFDPNQLNSFVRDVYALAKSNPKFLQQFNAKSVEDLNDTDWRVIYDDYAQNMTITGRTNATRDKGDGLISGPPASVGLRNTKAMDFYSGDNEAPNSISLFQSLKGAAGFGSKADQLTATIRGADGNAQRRILSDLVQEDPREVMKVLDIMARTDPKGAKALEAELFNRKQ